MHRRIWAFLVWPVIAFGGSLIFLREAVLTTSSPENIVYYSRFSMLLVLLILVSYYTALLILITDRYPRRDGQGQGKLIRHLFTARTAESGTGLAWTPWLPRLIALCGLAVVLLYIGYVFLV